MPFQLTDFIFCVKLQGAIGKPVKNIIFYFFKGQKWHTSLLTNVEKRFTLLFFSLRKNSFLPVAQLIPSPSIFPCMSCLYPYEFSAYMHKWIPIICTCPYNLCPHLHNLHLGTCAFPSLCSLWLDCELLPLASLPSPVLFHQTLTLSLSFCRFHVLTRPYFPPLSDETSLKSRLSQQRHDSEGMVAGYLSVERWGFSDRPKSINQTLKLAFFLVSEYVHHSNTIVNVHQQ